MVAIPRKVALVLKATLSGDIACAIACAPPCREIIRELRMLKQVYRSRLLRACNTDVSSRGCILNLGSFGACWRRNSDTSWLFLLFRGLSKPAPPECTGPCIPLRGYRSKKRFQPSSPTPRTTCAPVRALWQGFRIWDGCTGRIAIRMSFWRPFADPMCSKMERIGLKKCSF